MPNSLSDPSSKSRKILLLFDKKANPDAVFMNMKNVRYRFGRWAGESTTDDPQIYLYNKGTEPIDASKYRFIKFSLFSSRAARGQLFWWLNNGNWQSSKHFHVSEGWKEYSFDMNEMSPLGTFIGPGIGWEGFVGRLRLDPAERENVFIKVRKVKLTSVPPPKKENKGIILLADITNSYETAFMNMRNIKYRFGIWTGESTNDDPGIYLYNNELQPIDALKYRFIKFSLFSSRATRGQFCWWLINGNWQASKNFPVSKGWRDYCFDMNCVPTYGTFMGSGVGWEGLVRRLRLDPAEQEGIFIKVRRAKITSIPPKRITFFANPPEGDKMLGRNRKLNRIECGKFLSIMESKPVLVHAEISTKCNLRCKMCGRIYYNIPSSEQGFMQKEVFDKLSKIFTPREQLILYGRGESLLHPDFAYFLQVAANHRMRVSFNTNGSIMTGSIARAMVINKQESVTFSCSAGRADTYQKIHCGNTWNRLWDNINTINQEKMKLAKDARDITYMPPLIYLEFISQFSNIYELPLLLRKAFKYNLKGLMVNNLVAHSKEMGEELMNTEAKIPIANKIYGETVDLLKKLSKQRISNFDLMLPSTVSAVTKKFVTVSEKKRLDGICASADKDNTAVVEAGFCLEPWRTFYVRFDGTVAPCCVTGRVLGDLNKATAEEIWNGEMFQKFRQRMRGKDKPYECLRCHLFPGVKRYDKGLDNVVMYEPL